MAYDVEATLTSKGQVTVPARIRKSLGVEAGDRLRFHVSDSGELTVTPRRRHSLLDDAETMPLPRRGRPIASQDVDQAVGEAMEAQDARIRGLGKR